MSPPNMRPVEIEGKGCLGCRMDRAPNHPSPGHIWLAGFVQALGIVAVGGKRQAQDQVLEKLCSDHGERACALLIEFLQANGIRLEPDA